jgi:hypothetical protein
MKRTISLLLLAGCAFALPAAAETISLIQEPSVGSTFDVAVDLTGAFDTHSPSDELFGYGFNVSFDPSAVSFVGETPGPFFDDFSGIFPDAQVAGFVSAPLFFLGPLDFTEPLTLAVLQFSAIGTGTTAIRISGDPSAGVDQGLFYLSSADPISASLTANLPEPAPVLFTGAAMVGLILLRRRRVRS